MNFKADYLYQDPDGKTYTYFNPDDGSLVMYHGVDLEKAPRAEVPNPEILPDAFPLGWMGPHYVKNDVLYDFRVVIYEYKVDLTAIPPAFIKSDKLQDFLNIKMDINDFKETVLLRIKRHYQELASRSDGIAMEYFKKKNLLPEYNMSVDPDSLILLKQYPVITQRFNEAKTFILSITQDMLDDPNQRPGVVRRLTELLSEDFFKA